MGKNLLVADDDPLIAKLVAEAFSGTTFMVAAAGGGAEALEKLKSDRPALMILDINMPEVDGVDVLKAALEIHPDLPVIVVTGSADEKIAKLMISLGAKDYILKPMNLNYLQTAVWANVPI